VQKQAAASNKQHWQFRHPQACAAIGDQLQLFRKRQGHPFRLNRAYAVLKRPVHLTELRLYGNGRMVMGKWNFPNAMLLW